jgi:Arc/MetJ-type ribon-helix-helix transcriptional regulator
MILYRAITNNRSLSNPQQENRKMKLITLYLPEPYLQALEWLINEQYYPNRAEAIRFAIRDLISKEVWGRKKSDN